MSTKLRGHCTETSKKSSYTLLALVPPASRHSSVPRDCLSLWLLPWGRRGWGRGSVASIKHPWRFWYTASGARFCLISKCWWNQHSSDAWAAKNKGKRGRQHAVDLLQLWDWEKAQKPRRLLQKEGRRVECASRIPDFQCALCLTRSTTGTGILWWEQLKTKGKGWVLSVWEASRFFCWAYWWGSFPVKVNSKALGEGAVYSNAQKPT